MTWLRLSWANLWHNPLSTLVNAMLMALGTASIILLLLAGEQFARVVARDAQGIDLVVGAKGSPLQLVLSSVYHADIPTGNISLDAASHWANDRRVARAIPLSLGDSYHGFRIVGTSSDYADLYHAELAHGRFWSAPLEAVVGAAVAREAGLAPDSLFSGAHGLGSGTQTHDAHAYRVVGVLQATGSVLDRLILTSLDSVWELHDHASPHHDEHEDRHEITAMLLSYASPMAALSLPREINAAANVQAAAPAFELARLLNLVGLGLDGLRAFAAILLITAGFSIFAALYGALQARRYDLAMLRCLGASRPELMLSLLLEGLLLTTLGVALGFALGHGAMAALATWLEASRGIVISGGIWLAQEFVLLVGLLGMGLLAAALPAWQAYRNDVASTLTGQH